MIKREDRSALAESSRVRLDVPEYRDSTGETPVLRKKRTPVLSGSTVRALAQDPRLRVQQAAVLKNREHIVERLKDLHRLIRSAIIDGRSRRGLHEVARATAADTIYRIDELIEPAVERFFGEWGRVAPLVLVAEGLEGDGGVEGIQTYPQGTRPEDAELRVIIDPIDGTRQIMYDKRAAWSLAGVAPNKGDGTRLSDIEVAVMSELPTSKMGQADVLWAIKGQGAHGQRVDLATGESRALEFAPSLAVNIDRGFASVSSFFPGTKVLAAEALEAIVSQLVDISDVRKATVFEDQYITTGGQWYELIVGHDLFNADLRPYFYRIRNQPAGLCVHPYDCAAMLVAQEAGVILTDGLGDPLDGPMDVTTPLAWAGYANRELHRKIQPLLTRFLRARGL